MIRTAILAAALALFAGSAFANSWTFDDAYWKRPATAGAVQTAQSDDLRGKYDQVDRYNP